MADRGRARGVVATAVALVAALLLTGCVTLPHEGPVEEGPAQVAADPAPRIIPDGPQENAAPDAVVRGWLTASAAFDDDYSVARSFLTAPAASSWRPGGRVVVVATGGLEVQEEAAGPGRGDGATEPSAGERRSVTVGAPLLGVVDDRGRWTSAEPRTPYTVEVTVVRVSGAWRITELPDEVVVSRNFFDQQYGAFQLQHLSPDGRALVPETRWFPQRQATATLLVSELLSTDRSSWLADATSTAFPAGTTLLSSPPAVPVEGTTAVVDLSAEARTATPEQRLLMQAQVTGTLRGVPGVTDVRLAAEGSALTLPPGTADVLDDPVVTGTPVVVEGGRLARLDGEGVEILGGVPDLAGRRPRLPAVAGDVLAVLVDDRTGMVVVRLPGEAATVPDDAAAGGDLEVVTPGTDLVGPSVDRFGWAWTARAGAGDDAGLVAADADGDVAKVDAPWLTGRRVYALQVSRDGARVAVLSTDAAGTPGTAQLRVAGVERSPGGSPARVEEAGDPLPGLVDALDLTWVDGQTVAVLGRVRGQDGADPDARLRLLEVAVDGSVVRSTDVTQDAVRVTSAKGRSTVLLETAGGLLQRSGGSFVPRPGAAGVDASFPG